MSKIQIKQLQENELKLKDLNYWEAKEVIGGVGKVSSKNMIKKAVQKALVRQDISSNGTIPNP